MCAARLSPRRLVRSLTQPLLPVPRWRGTVHRIGLIRRPSRLCVAAHAGCAVHGRVEAGRAVPDGALRPQWRFASCDERDDAAILVSLTRSPALCLIRVYISSFLKSQGALRDEGGRRARGYASPRGKNKPDVQAGCQLASCRSPRTRHVGSDNNLIYLEIRARSPPPRKDRPWSSALCMANRQSSMAEWSVPAPQRVVFCNNCGTLMEEPTFANTNVLCRMCGTVTPSKGAALAATSRACARLTPSASAQCLRSSW